MRGRTNDGEWKQTTDTHQKDEYWSSNLMFTTFQREREREREGGSEVELSCSVLIKKKDITYL